MRSKMGSRRWATVILGALLVAAPAAATAAATSAKEMYAAAMAREKTLRAAWEESAGAPPAAALKQARSIASAYEAIVRRYPTSGYCDNALWQAASLAADAFARSQQDSDRRTALRLLEFLAREYPTSPFAKKAADQARRLQSSAPANASNTAKGAETSNRGREGSANPTPARPVGEDPASSSIRATPSLSTIREIRRTVLTEVVRVSIELDREVVFHEERVENPARLLFDLPSTKAAPSLQDADWTYRDDIVRRIRVGRHPNQTTRVVLDLEGVSRYTVVTLYNPYRILIDCERQAPPSAVTGQRADHAPNPQPKISSPAGSGAEPGRADAIRPNAAKAESAPPRASVGTGQAAGSAASTSKSEATQAEGMPNDPPKKSEPARTPAGEKNGPTVADRSRVSMGRQLGLGIARIVIDPGHGGRDPGAEGPSITEAQVVLDIALRLEKLLARQPGVEVVLTRHIDVFVPLEERTDIANREQADLFLSIHANASRNQNARGIESYYLNFATNPDAEAVAARENSASERTMNSLPDIVKAIALNNKLDESKDFATLVQQALARRLRSSNKSIKDLGVKQAPFVVLIGAAMPSVLAEVSFVTNRREAQLLRNETYRQRIAEGLADAILRYKRALKNAKVVAHQ